VKILITGSNGLVGQKLVQALRNRPHITLLATSKGENRISTTQGYTFQSLDITNAAQIETTIERFRPEVILHTAALTQVDFCEKNQADCWKMNVDAVASLIRSSEKWGCHLIHLSTDFVFDGLHGPYTETDPPSPVNFYGQSKFAAEELLRKSVVPWTIIRTILVYGVIENRSRSNIVLWIKESLEKKQPIKVVSDQFRMPTLAEDLAEACVSAALKKKTGIYHISGNEFMSIFELAKEVADFFNLDSSFMKPVPSASLNEPARRPPKTSFILDKATQDLNYRPHSFKKGLTVIKKQLEALPGSADKKKT